MTMTEQDRRDKISKAMVRIWASRSPKEKARVMRGVWGIGNPMPRKCRQMTPVECAWLGAFIEADGCASLVTNRWPPQKKTYTYPQLRITQKIVDPIAVALRITQCGFVSLSNDQWVWAPSSMADTLAVANQCAPYSWKIQKMLREWKHEQEVMNDDD